MLIRLTLTLTAEEFLHRVSMENPYYFLRTDGVLYKYPNHLPFGSISSFSQVFLLFNPMKLLFICQSSVHKIFRTLQKHYASKAFTFTSIRITSLYAALINTSLMKAFVSWSRTTWRPDDGSTRVSRFNWGSHLEENADCRLEGND